MADDIREGSVVRLASGGPEMTVERFLNDGRAFCQWFDEKKTLQSGTFPRSSLVSAKPNSTPPFYTG